MPHGVDGGDRKFNRAIDQFEVDHVPGFADFSAHSNGALNTFHSRVFRVDRSHFPDEQAKRNACLGVDHNWTMLQWKL